MKQNHDSADRRKKFGQICFVTAKSFWFRTNNYVSMHLLLRKSKYLAKYLIQKGTLLR